VRTPSGSDRSPDYKELMRRLILTLAALSIAAVVAVGCGKDEQAASGAAELAPAGSVMYGEATLKPEGDQKEAIDAILAKFPGGGQAGDKLKDLIEKAMRESDAPISFKEDIEPWLGDEAAFFVSNLDPTGEAQSAAGLIATTDEDKARAALEKSAEGKLVKHNYKDVEYLTDESKEAGAVLDGFLVLGSEAGVKAAIDTSKGDTPLSDDENYKNALDDAADDRLGFFYINSPELLRSLRESGTPLPGSFKKFFEEPLVATLDADKDGVVFEGTVPAEIGRASLFGQASDLVEELPGDSWLALGQSDFGKLLDFYVGAFGGVAGGRDAIEQQFKATTGLDIQKDVIDWMGDFGIFVRGKSVPDLDGALIVETKDEAASGRFIAALERLAKTQGQGAVRIGPLTAPGGGKGFTAQGSDIPKPIHVFQKSGRVVFAYGDAAASDAVNPANKLGDTAEYTAATESLGDYDVSFYLLTRPILELVDSTEAATDADWQKAKPYLEPLSALVGGTSGDGDDLRSAVKLIVK
jgi:uncharacterized protein DUF3352